MMKNESIKIWLEHETMVDISFLYLSVKSKVPLPGKDWEAHRRRWGEWSLGDGVGVGAWPTSPAGRSRSCRLFDGHSQDRGLSWPVVHYEIGSTSGNVDSPPKMGWLEQPTKKNMFGHVWPPQTSPEKLWKVHVSCRMAPPSRRRT